MPTLITKRGKKRWKAVAIFNKERKEKLFPDNSKRSRVEAGQWEIETQERMKKEYDQQGSLIDTDYLAVRKWIEGYMDVVKQKFVKKTYQEKKDAFKILLADESIHANTPVADITVEIANKILSREFNKRSGNAVNRVRKNMAAAWRWGRQCLKDFPKEGNPFSAVAPFPEITQPRYVPPEEDFWKVFEAAGQSSEGDLVAKQDQTILLTFLHCAGRRGEIWRIKLSDLDFPNGRLRLYTRKRKNGNYESDWLPMTRDLKSALLKWSEIRLGMNTIDKEHLFVCLSKTHFCEDYYGKPFKNRQHYMKKLCAKAKVKPFGFHAIRHLTATILFHKGYRLGMIQAMLRHKSQATTQIYLKSMGIEEIRSDLEEALSRSTQIIPFHKNKTPQKTTSEG